ncbi:MAG TPA: sortase, partial [Patescibacteria group bacterium]|nr:sortase [Patescibacteria group bacterium]
SPAPGHASGSGFSAKGAVKAVAPYVALFCIGAALYYLFFTDFSFTALTRNWFKTQTQSESLRKQQALNTLKTQYGADYVAWIRSYYFEVNDPKIIDADADLSGNGLTNFQKYLLGLSPKSFDTLGLGRSDTQTLVAGFNPLNNLPLTDSEKKMIDAYIDLEVALNRATGSPAAPRSNTKQLPLRGYELNTVQAASAVTARNTAAVVQTPAAALPKPVAQTVQVRQSTTRNTISRTNTAKPTATSAMKTKATAKKPTVQKAVAPLPATKRIVPKDAVPVGTDYNHLDINLNIAGELEVPTLKLKTPIIFAHSDASLDEDLKRGVVKMARSALPGDIGTAYVTGHSSGYVWDTSPYRKIFENIDSLQKYNTFYITVTTMKGKKVRLTYVVEDKKEYKPDDQVQFENLAYSRAALSTCWPIGGTAKRMVVFGKLTKIQ